MDRVSGALAQSPCRKIAVDLAPAHPALLHASECPTLPPTNKQNCKTDHKSPPGKYFDVNYFVYCQIRGAIQNIMYRLFIGLICIVVYILKCIGWDNITIVFSCILLIVS